MSRMLRKYEQALGGNIRINYHAFRHTFWTQLLKKGASLKTVQEMMGHSTILTTQHYIQVDKENMRQAQLLLIGDHILHSV
jgi:site-specific recombinase XerD